MKRFIRPISLAFLPLIAFAAVGIAHARGGFRHGGHDPAKMKSFIEGRVSSELSALKATDAQRTQIVGIVDTFLDTAFAGHDGDRGTLKATLAAALESGDTTTLDQLIDEHATKKTAIAHDAVRAGMQIRSVLTVEQRAQLATDIREHKGWGKF